MDIQSIILSCVSLILTSLVSWAIERLVSWLNAKVKGENQIRWATEAAQIVTNAVKATYQTYVSTLKNKNIFDEAAQKEALQKTVDAVLGQLSDDTKKYIETNFGDITEWVTSTIEAKIYDLKNRNKKK